jgi:hypothetical protein
MSWADRSPVILGPKNSANRHGVCKPRFGAADYNDIPHDQRAMDRDITIVQIATGSEALPPAIPKSSQKARRVN